MGTFVYIDAPIETREQLAGVPAGTHAALERAHTACSKASIYDEDAAWDALTAARHAIDPTNAYSPYGWFDDGLHRLQTESAFLKAHGLDAVCDGTSDPALVRVLLEKQRAYVDRRSIVIGATPAEVAEVNAHHLAVINHLITALDSGVRFGLCWS